MVFVKTPENFIQGFEIILKIDQNNAFVCPIFKEMFENFLMNFPTICIFRPNHENLTQFLIFLKNRLK